MGLDRESAVQGRRDTITMVSSKVWTRTASAAAALLLTAAAPGAALAAGGHGNGNANGAGNGNGGSNAHANGGTGHTPVTVCHRLGNGGYHVLTMDDSALKAHLGHGDLYPVPADGCPAAPAQAPTKTPAKNSGKKGPDHSGQDHSGQDHAGTPHRHTPVTVCHRLGNGGYHVLTMDDSALKAHLGHGDLYPVPADGCPAAPAKQPAPGAPAPDQGSTGTGSTDTTSTSTTTTGTTGSGAATSARTTPGATVLGDQATRVQDQSRTPARAPQVLGTSATLGSPSTGATAGTAAGTNAATTAAAPQAGILPQTGAGRYGPVLLAGLGLLAAGGAALRRDRKRTTA